MRLDPINSRVIIKPDEPDEQIGVIWIPDPKKIAAEKTARTGRVVSFGPGMKVRDDRLGWKGPVDANGYRRYPMPDIKVGDRVVYLTWALGNNTIEINGEEHHVVRANDSLLGVVEEAVSNG